MTPVSTGICNKSGTDMIATRRRSKPYAAAEACNGTFVPDSTLMEESTGATRVRPGYRSCMESGPRTCTHSATPSDADSTLSRKNDPNRQGGQNLLWNGDRVAVG